MTMMDELVTLRNHRKIFVRDGFHVGGKPACIKVRLTTGLKRRQELVAHLRDQQQLLYFCAVFLPILPLYLYFYPFYPLLLLLNGNQLDAARQGVRVLWKIQFQAFMLSRQQQ